MRISIEWRYKKFGKTAVTKGTNTEKIKKQKKFEK